MIYHNVSARAVFRGCMLLLVVWLMSLPAVSRNLNDHPWHAAADDDAGTAPGLHYAYYEGVWAALPDFSSLTPVEEGSVPAPSIALRHRELDFGFVFSGSITVPTTGKYTFYLMSDDGTKLFIDGAMLITNDTLHEERERIRSVNLTAGSHTLKLEYFQHQGPHALALSYSGPGISRQTIPSDAYSRPNTLTGVKLEAETAYLSGLTVMSNYAGYTGSGFVKYLHPSGDTIRWTAYIPSAGTYKLTFRYALEYATQAVNVSVNGKVSNGAFSFANTTTWANWSTASIKADLTTGLNTILISGVGNGGPNLDHLVIEEWKEVITGNEENADRSSQFTVYPNPTAQQVFINLASGSNRAITIMLVNTQGMLVRQQAYAVQPNETPTLSLDVSTVTNGLYRVIIQRGNITESRNLVVSK